MLIGILLTIAIPHYLRAKRSTGTKTCVANLQKIDCAKTEWAMENNQLGTAVPDPDALLAYLTPSALPRCPEGTDTYAMVAVDTKTACPNVGVYADHVQP